MECSDAAILIKAAVCLEHHAWVKVLDIAAAAMNV